jgi:HlyD family secretion protein
VAQQTLEKLKRGALSEEIDATRARRDQAIAQVDLVKKRIRDSYIISPTHGIVTLKGVEVGELVGIGTNLFRITYLDKVKLTIYIGEEDLPKVRLGQKASVSVDAYKDRTFEGEVIYKSPVAEFTPKNVQTKEERTKLVYAVKIQVANPEGALSPGLPADARLSVQ